MTKLSCSTNHPKSQWLKKIMIYSKSCVNLFSRWKNWDMGKLNNLSKVGQIQIVKSGFKIRESGLRISTSLLTMLPGTGTLFVSCRVEVGWVCMSYPAISNMFLLWEIPEGTGGRRWQRQGTTECEGLQYQRKRGGTSFPILRQKQEESCFFSPALSSFFQPN